MKHISKWWPVYGGVLLVFGIVYFYLYKTSSSLAHLSDKREDWNDVAEFVSFLVSPIIAAVGLYYIWKTVKIQNANNKLQVESAELQIQIKYVEQLENSLDFAVKEIVTANEQGITDAVIKLNTICYKLKVYNSLKEDFVKAKVNDMLASRINKLFDDYDTNIFIILEKMKAFIWVARKGFYSNEVLGKSKYNFLIVKKFIDLSVYRNIIKY
jgi:hypothetical protein